MFSIEFNISKNPFSCINLTIQSVLLAFILTSNLFNTFSFLIMTNRAQNSGEALFNSELLLSDLIKDETNCLKNVNCEWKNNKVYMNNKLYDGSYCKKL